MPKNDAHVAALRAETAAKKALVVPLVPQVLERARDLLDDRSRWTSGTVARIEGGGQTTPDDPDAVTWCAVGALDKCAREVWIASDLAETWPNGSQMLFHVAKEVAVTHIVEAAKALGREETPNHRISSASIPAINDHPAQGGYSAVISGLYLATGRTISDRVAAFAKRSQAARKAWETRRAKEVAEWRAYMARREEDKQRKQREAEEAKQVMVIGGTVPPSTNITTNADAKETADVSAR